MSQYKPTKETSATVVTSGAVRIIKPRIIPAIPSAAAKAAAEGPPIISPFDIMIEHGKNLPLENWRPAN
jgi:hypothetical protein